MTNKSLNFPNQPLVLDQSPNLDLSHLSNQVQSSDSLDLVEALKFFWSMRFWILAGIILGNVFGIVLVNTVRRPHFVTSVPYQLIGSNVSLSDTAVIDQFNLLFRSDAFALEFYDTLSHELSPWVWDRQSFIFKQTGLAGNHEMPFSIVVKAPMPLIEWTDFVNDPSGTRVEKILAFVTAYQNRIFQEKIKALQEQISLTKFNPKEVVKSKNDYQMLLNSQIKEELLVKSKIMELAYELRAYDGTSQHLKQFGTDINWEQELLEHLVFLRKKLPEKVIDDYLGKLSLLVSKSRMVKDKYQILSHDRQQAYIEVLTTQISNEKKFTEMTTHLNPPPNVIKLNETAFRQSVALSTHQIRVSGAPFIFAIASIFGAMCGIAAYCSYDFWQRNRHRIVRAFSMR